MEGREEKPGRKEDTVLGAVFRESLVSGQVAILAKVLGELGLGTGEVARGEREESRLEERNEESWKGMRWWVG